MSLFLLISHLYKLITIPDVIEIFICAVPFYYFSLWLKKDRQKNLLGYFYSYCFMTAACHIAHLFTLSTFLLILSPIVFMLFILFHQELLQRNFVALANIKPAKAVSETNWLETVIRSCLVAMHNNKTIRVVVEHTQSLATFITSPTMLYIDIQKNIITMALSAENYDDTTMLWLNSHGKIVGLNAEWKTQFDQEWITGNTYVLTPWQQAALFFSSKTDAIVFELNPLSQNFTIFAQSKLFDNVPAHHALKTINKFLTLTPTTIGDIVHEEHSKKQPYRQRNS